MAKSKQEVRALMDALKTDVDAMSDKAMAVMVRDSRMSDRHQIDSWLLAGDRGIIFNHCTLTLGEYHCKLALLENGREVFSVWFDDVDLGYLRAAEWLMLQSLQRAKGKP